MRMARSKTCLQRCGIANCFRTITDSGVVGHEKPHPEIFRQALKSMNATPDESLYVGDVYSVDYLGATGAGMQAILMDVPAPTAIKDCQSGVAGRIAKARLIA